MKQSTPKSTHSYFRVINLDEQKQDFLSNKLSSSPIFKYPDSLDVTSIEALKNGLSLEAKGAHSDLILPLDLALVSAKIQAGINLDKSIGEFRNLNEKLYGKPNPDFVLAILKRIKQNVNKSNRDYWLYATSLISSQIDEILIDNPWPSDDFFKVIKSYGERYMYPLLNQTDEADLPDIFSVIMREVGLIDEGWVLRLIEDSSSARTLHSQKKIILGKDYKVRNKKAYLRIVAHEVYGHAIRGSGLGLRESEGFAILLEQVFDNEFKPRRSIRYLCAALAWGVLSESMNFRQTFEIIWRLMVIWARYDDESARSYAFNECVRVFRGGLPDKPGAVFLKDIVYFDANIEMWQSLKNANISYNDFMEIASGKNRVLQ